MHLEEHVWMIHACSFQKLQLLSRQCGILNIYRPMLDAKNLINVSILYFKETINIVFTVNKCRSVDYLIICKYNLFNI